MESIQHWRKPGNFEAIGDQILHVWRVRLQCATRFSTDALFPLDESERTRAQRFSNPTAMRHYVLMRKALRSVLSRYIQLPPDKIRLEYNEAGKPLLPGNAVHFNLSHSEDWGLIAVTKDKPVGVDIEKLNPKRTLHEIASRFFSPAENAALSSLADPNEKTHAFFRCWSRKEAVIKALGEGLSCGLSTFDVSLDENNPRLLDFRRETIDVHAWTLVEVVADPEYAASAAVRGCCQRALGFDIEPKSGS